MEDINRAGTMYRRHCSILKTKVVLVVYSFWRLSECFMIFGGKCEKQSHKWYYISVSIATVYIPRINHIYIQPKFIQNSMEYGPSSSPSAEHQSQYPVVCKYL
jgi:hypothetical protein